MRDHADKMYDLIPDSKDPASAEYKGKHAAMWHEHEINKYRFQIDYIVSKIKKGEIE